MNKTMHARTGTPKDALLPLINDLYERIRVLEADNGFWAGANDFRPRIELFHDAIRALIAGHSPYETKGRLTLERLAWDIETLRTLQANPLMKLPGAEKLSPSQAVALRRDAGEQRQYHRSLRTELAELYKNYTVLFVAMLAETADMNHKARMEEKDLLVEELAALEHGISGKTSINLHKLADSLIHDDEICTTLKQSLPAGTLSALDARKTIKAAQTQADKQKAQLEKLHIAWLSSQLALYEESKQLVQEFMNRGLNMAGKFLQNAMQQGAGRGARGF